MSSPASSSSSGTPKAQEIRTPVAGCPIKNITVYSDRAEVTRTLRVDLPQVGQYDIKVTGMSTNVEENSVHVGGGVGNATILEVSYYTKHETKDNDNSDKAARQRELEDLDEELIRVQEEMDRVERERSWLEGRAGTLRDYSGSGAKEDKYNPYDETAMKSMETFLEFYNKNLTRLDRSRAEAKTKQKRLEEQRQVLRSRGPHGNRVSVTREVTVSIEAGGKGELVLELSYVIRQCAWVPSYDVRVDSNAGRASLIYYGAITNNSGEEWTDASLALSTASPALGGAPPPLTTMHVQYQYAHTVPAPSSARMMMNTAPLMAQAQSMPARGGAVRESLSLEQAMAPAPVAVLTAATASTSDLTAASFVISRKATIEADGRPHKVTIAMVELEAHFTHTIIAKLSPHAYLKASLLNNSTNPFLPGNINVFMDNNFIAQSTIKAVSPQEKFALFLGVDSSVRVEYKPVRKMAESISHGLLYKTNTSSETIKHKCVIKNTKATPVSIVYYDQLPLTSDEKIKVRLVEPDLRGYDKEGAANDEGDRYNIKLNGANNLEWRTRIEPAEELHIPFEYVVEWPKDRHIEYTA